VLGQVEVNLQKMAHWVDAVMREAPQTQLIVFPELANTGYECGDSFTRLAERASDSASLAAIAQCAQTHEVMIVVGFAEADAQHSHVLYNSAALIGADGRTLGVYRKVHPFDTEKQYFTAGCDYPVFDTPIGRLAMMICWDAGFPEVARSYALQGADIIIIPTNWEKPYQDDWDLVTRARAFDNTVYIVSANRVGPDLSLDWFGRSNIIDPVGRPIAALNEEVEGFITAALDLDWPKQLKASYYTFFQDRRPETYGRLVEPNTSTKSQ
jgi:predicted amidohydrolase